MAMLLAFGVMGDGLLPTWEAVMHVLRRHQNDGVPVPKPELLRPMPQWLVRLAERAEAVRQQRGGPLEGAAVAATIFAPAAPSTPPQPPAGPASGTSQQPAAASSTSSAAAWLQGGPSAAPPPQPALRPTQPAYSPPRRLTPTQPAAPPPPSAQAAVAAKVEDDAHDAEVVDSDDDGPASGQGVWAAPDDTEVEVVAGDDEGCSGQGRWTGQLRIVAGLVRPG